MKHKAHPPYLVLEREVKLLCKVRRGEKAGKAQRDAFHLSFMQIQRENVRRPKMNWRERINKSTNTEMPQDDGS